MVELLNCYYIFNVGFLALPCPTFRHSTVVSTPDTRERERERERDAMGDGPWYDLVMCVCDDQLTIYEYKTISGCKDNFWTTTEANLMHIRYRHR